MMDLYEEFRDLIEVLKHHGVEYAVRGGIAVAIHGYTRFTSGIDLLIRHEGRAERAGQDKGECSRLDLSDRLRDNGKSDGA